MADERRGAEVCPPESKWTELAAGVTAEGEAERLLEHASGCGACAENLQEAVYLLSGDDAEDEEHREPSAPVRKRFKHAWYWAAAAGIAIAVAGIQVWRSGSGPPFDLLAQAYTARRTVALRVPGAAHAPLRVERGAGSDSPSMLLEGEALIRKRMEAGSEEPEWLHASGLAAALKWDADSAIRSFQAAADAGANSAEFWINFGTAYYQRAQSRPAPVDYSNAIECLGKAVAIDGANSAAYFNRALAEEQLALIEPAIRDFESALRYEKDEAWRRETRERLEALRKRRARLLERGPEAEEFAEKALERALARGLPSEQWVSDLAALLARVNGDVWLRHAMGASVERKALSTLAAMARTRVAGRTQEYEEMGKSIDELVGEPLPKPLAAWRDFELLFRDSHSPNLAKCSARSIPSEYRWLAIQALLERSTCETGRGELMSADRSTSAAIALADEAQLPIARLRARGFQSSHYVNEGRHREVFALAQKALSEIEEHQYPLVRAHQYYNDLMRTAEQLGRWHTALAAETMAISVAAHTGLKTQEAQGWCKLAHFAAELNDVAEAERAYRKALELRGGLNGGAATFFDFVQVQYLRARRDGPGLQRMESQFGETENAFFAAPFWNAQATVAFATGDRGRAEMCAGKALSAVGKGSKDRLGGAQVRRFRAEHQAASELLIRAQIERGDAAGSLRSWLEYVSRDQELMGWGERPALTAVLEKQSVLITLAAIGPALAQWTQTERRLEVRWLPPSTLRELRRLQRLCSRPETGIATVMQAAERMGKILRAGQDLSGRSVRIFAREELASLPLALALGEAADVSVIPAAPAGRGKTEWSEGGTVALADVVAAELRADLPPLPSAEEEARVAASAISKAVLVRGIGPADLAKRAAGDGVFHYIGHAIRWRDGVGLAAAPEPDSQDSDRRSGVWMVTPGQRFGSALVFLSACSTAAFEETQTVRPGQLAEVVLLAGARQVVGTLWNIDSSAAAVFAKYFYGALKTGVSPAAALRRAAEGVRGHPEYRHPYYWAAFTLFEAV